MLDPTKPRMPAWKRYATMVLLPALIAVAAYVIWVKELHHPGPVTAKSERPAATAPVHQAPTSATTALPGGIAVSSRNPFGR